jgi:hypothetical protein
MVALFFILTTCLFDNSPSIEPYLSLHIQFDKDTICMGDSLTLDIEFRNKTLEDVEFYPYCFQKLSQPFANFETYESLILNNVADFTKLVKLSPDSIYKISIIIKPDSGLIHHRMNNIFMYYHCPKLKGKKFKKYNKLYGFLKSNIVNLYVYDCDN